MKALLLFALSAVVVADVLQAAPTLVGWDRIGRTAASKEIVVRLALKKDMRAIDEKVVAASTPGSATFREWATKDELDGMSRTASGSGVVAHLRSVGVDARIEGDSVIAELTAGKAETVFKTTIYDYKDANGQVWHRAGDVHAPVEVTSVVSAVYGLHGLPLPPRKAPTGVKGLRDPPNIGPSDLRKTYSVPDGVRGGTGSTAPRQAVAEFQGQFSNDQDLVSFFKQFVPYAKPGDDKVYAVKGNKGTGYGVEALLDIQYIMGVAPGVRTEFWGWRNQDFCSDLKNWTQTILADQDPPLVFSISYGWQGDLSQIGCETNQVKDIDLDLQKVAARGISIIFASGDSGSQQTGGKLWASWPASSNWVTAVGATTFTGAVGSEESASTQFGSGSGFSGHFPQAPFQRKVVSEYLQANKATLPPSSYFDANGRATADVSALGEGFQVMIQGSVGIVGGTSASTPTFAGIISLLNNERVTKGGKPLGFLNPWLYNKSGDFTDVTKGSDKISRGGTAFQYGFDCAKGWDPATGLGTPIYTKLQ